MNRYSAENVLTKQTTLYAGEWTRIITKVSCVINERGIMRKLVKEHMKSPYITL